MPSVQLKLALSAKRLKRLLPRRKPIDRKDDPPAPKR